jgi:hypothetical protein
MSTNSTLKTAILADDLSALAALLTSPPDPTITPLRALSLSAALSRPISFSDLITQHPTLTTSFNNQDLLINAVGSGSIPIWRIILAHRPEAKDQRFGHYGTVVERCVIGGERVLLEYLLAEGARVEATGRPILLRARLCGASEEIKELLVRYGARPVSKEEEEEEGLVGHQGGGSVLGGLWVTLLDLAERAGLRG